MRTDERFLPAWLVDIIFGIFIAVLSFILGYNYALASREPRTVVEEVRILEGEFEDVEFLIGRDLYACDLEFYNDSTLKDSAICEPIEGETNG